MTHYREHWHKSHVWLIDYSFGANVLPSLIERLPTEERSHVVALTLLGPTRDIFFRGRAGKLHAPGLAKATAYPGGHNFGGVFAPLATQILHDTVPLMPSCHG